MSQPNSWSNPSKVGASEAVQMAAFLEQRSNTADMVGVNHKLNEVMAGKPGERLLEVGSGSGVLCRMVAASIRPSGFITGLDISPEMSTEAYRYARSMGTPSGIVFHVGSAECLPYPEGNFDGAFAARRLSWRDVRGAFRSHHAVLLLLVDPDLHQLAEGWRSPWGDLFLPHHLADHQRVPCHPDGRGIRQSPGREIA